MELSTSERAAEAQRGFEIRYGGAPPEAIVQLYSIPLDRSKPTKFYHVKVSELSVIARRVAATGMNVHLFSRATLLEKEPLKGRGTEGDTLGSMVVWVDCDVIANKLDFEETLQRLRGFDPPPTAITHSGGGYYGFWKLAGLERDWQRVKRVNSWLSQQLSAAGADPASVDAARILRLEGTFNCKPDRQRWVQIVEYDPERTYGIDQFGEVAVSSEQVEPIEQEELPSGFLEQLERDHTDLFARIVSESTARSARASLNADGSGVSRHRNDWLVCCNLLRMGYTPGQCVAVLTHPHWFTGSKYREEGHITYVYRTVARAQRVVRRAPASHFERNKPVSSKIGRDILACDHYLNVGEALYHYDEHEGVYHSDGAHYLAQVIKGRLGDTWTGPRARDIEAYVMTDVERYPNRAPYTRFVNVLNGMLDVKDRVLLAHGPEYRSIAQLPVRYDPTAPRDEVETFIAQILHPEDIPTWWQAVGYTLWNKCEYKMMALLYGPPDSGKSQLLDLLRAFLGTDNTCSIEPGELEDRFSLARFVGKLANICPDINTERQLINSSILKRLADGSMIEAQHKNKPRFQFVNRAKLFFAGNSFPRVETGDSGFYRRCLVFRCDNMFKEGVNARPMLGELVASNPANLSAMLNLALEGLQSLREHRGFVRSDEQRAVLGEFQREVDSVLDFWLSSTVKEDGYKLTKQAAYDSYVKWALLTSRRPVSMTTFGKRTHLRFVDLGMTDAHTAYLHRRVVDEKAKMHPLFERREEEVKN